MFYYQKIQDKLNWKPAWKYISLIIVGLIPASSLPNSTEIQRIKLRLQSVQWSYAYSKTEFYRLFM